MKATKEQLETQNEELKKFLENAKYDNVLEDGLLEDLRMRIRVFTLCMERTIADGFDPPSEEQMISLSEYWFELNHNLLTALELLKMAQSTIQGFRYDAGQKGNFISFESLQNRMTENES